MLSIAVFLRDDHASVRQEREAPAELEFRHFRDRERKALFHLQLARVGLRSRGGRHQRHEHRSSQKRFHSAPSLGHHYPLRTTKYG
jgi:hypothetical protein